MGSDFLIKRAIVVFLVLVMAFAGVGARIISVGSESIQAAGVASGMMVDVTTLRGTIYDCNMNPLTNAETEIYAAAKPTNRAIGILKECLQPEIFESVKERMSKGKPVVVKTEMSVEETDDIKTIFVAKRYSVSSLACHVIGYLDGEKNGVSGIEKSYNDILSQAVSNVTARFSANAGGRVMIGEDVEISGTEAPKSGVALTIDKNIQQITELALDNSGAECAAAVVIEIESGAIKACVSRPAFDQTDVGASLNDVNSPLINRAFLPFSVGSVFKPVVAAAALEKGISDGFEYNCTGSVVHNGVTFNCHKHSGHGVLDMQGAVANSCNTYFIALAIETGADALTETAGKFHFGEEVIFADGMKSSAGYLPQADELDSKAAIANISFGQGSLLATPVQICAMTAAIARNGVYVQPYLIEGEVNEKGELTRIVNYGERKQIISETTAKKLRKYLEKVVEDGSGRRAAGKIVSSAGKTATAQTGKSENGEEIYNAWFSGYFPADNPKYAVTILKENGGEGSLSCAPVFKTIAETIMLSE